MRILFWGKGPRGRVCLARLFADGFEIAGVISETEEAAGEAGTHLRQAEERGVPYHIVKRIRSEEVLELVRPLEARIFVLAGYTRILPPAVLELPPLGVVNLHGGRLPDYRGCAPIPWQIIRGEKKLGLTVLYADAGIDTGAVLGEESYALSPEQGATEAVAKTLECFPRMLSEVLRGLREGSLRGRPQDLAAGAYYCRRYPEDGLVDCRLVTAAEIFNLVRGLRSPYPGAFAWRGEEKVVLQRARLLREDIFGVAGQVPLRRPDGVVLIARDRGLLVTELRRGEEIIPAGEILRPGDRLLCRPS